MMTNRTNNARVARRSDAGMTLTELLVVTSMLGMILVVLVSAITVIFRSERGVTATVTESHDVQQTVNYFYRDVQSGPFDPAAYRGTDGDPAGSGCSEAGDENVFRYDAGGRRIAYRLTDEGDTARLDRYVCTLAGGSWTEDEIVNLADALSVADRAIEVAVIDDDADGEVERVSMSLPQSGTLTEVAASPQAQTGVLPAVAAAVCTDDPLAAALGFPGFVLGDVVLEGGKVYGALAVGGSLRWNDDVQVARNDKNSDYGQVALYAAAIDWPSRGSDELQVDGGDVVLGGDYYYDSRRGKVYEDDSRNGDEMDVKKDVIDIGDLMLGAIDFVAQFDALRACSNALSKLPDPETCVDCAVDVVPLAENCRTAYSGHGDVCIEVSSQDVQVLTIPESVLDTVDAFDFTGSGLSSAHPLVINVMDDGDGKIAFDTATANFEARGNAKFVLFNFYDATEVDVMGEFSGTILAPFAHVITQNDVLGGVYAASWTHEDGDIENDGDNNFRATIDWGNP